MEQRPNSPCREVKIELAQSTTEEKLASFGEIEAIAEQELRFLVPRENLTARVTHLLSKLQIQDLSVNEPPIEEVIGHLFQANEIS